MIEDESIRKVGITIHPLIIMNIVEMKFTSIAARTPPGRATEAGGTVGVVEFGIRARPTTAGSRHFPVKIFSQNFPGRLDIRLRVCYTMHIK